MIGIIIGILVGFTIVWILFSVWDYICYVEPYDIDEAELIDNEVFDAIKCPNCGCYEYQTLYVDELFMKGKYARCKSCGWTFDLVD